MTTTAKKSSPNVPPILLDDKDVQIALKLSEDLHLNEIGCVHLLAYAKQAFDLVGREPQEILRLATGLLYTERRDLLTALYAFLRLSHSPPARTYHSKSVVVLVQGLEADIVSDIQKYLENLISNGLRLRLISLIKELSREEPAGLAVVCRERLILGHCLVLSVLFVRTSPEDVKDIFLVLKDGASELSGTNVTIKCQTCFFLYITFSLLFSLVIASVLDAVLSRDASFRHDFHEIVMAAGNDPNVEGFVGSIRLAWTVHLVLTQDALTGRDTISSASSSDLGYLQSCLEVIFVRKINYFIYLLIE
ncbi:hypothetical protein M0R45_015239 [Rubus argutus]|uniref:Uncharacterized protein n=1 Tax=Rubus argutus TaxID=59490 RepID=A0AAW1XSE7_RUBAR